MTGSEREQQHQLRPWRAIEHIERRRAADHRVAGPCTPEDGSGVARSMARVALRARQRRRREAVPASDQRAGRSADRTARADAARFTDMTWLVTGGAGYIGAHVANAMTGAGESVVVLDDLSSGRADRLGDVAPLAVGSVLDAALVSELLRVRGVTGIVHIAAKKQVAESVARPLDYYRENVTGLQTVLQAAVAAGVRRFVFSSSAAVYGAPDVAEVTEETDPAPVSPYGETKLVGEWLIRAVAAAHPMRYVSLRYFNVVGAARPELGDLGVFNLVPMVFERISAGKPPVIFGDDYDTPDGTCIRDYVHVSDIASAHLAAARYLRTTSGGSLVVNVGRGDGVSVREMIDTILEITGHQDLRPQVTSRRPGDPARVVARADRIRTALEWSARHDLRSMVESAWEGWCRMHPDASRR